MTGSVFHRYRNASALCITLLAAIALGGCRDKEKYESPPIISTPRNPLEIPLVEKPTPLSAIPLPAPPLRRALSDPPRSNASFSALCDPPAITFRVVQDAGQTNLRAQFVPGSVDQNSAIAEELRALGFIEGTPQIWSRQFSAANREALEQNVWTRLTEATRLAREQALLVQRAQQTPVKGSDRPIVYTGHPLDIAITDPEIFIRVRLNVDASSHNDEQSNYEGYVRGGQLLVNPAGRLRLERFTLTGITHAVPANTERIVVKNNGSVAALSPDGKSTELGTIELFRVYKPIYNPERGLVVPATEAAQPERVTLDNPNSPLLIGHLEVAKQDEAAVSRTLAARHVLETLLTTLSQPAQNAATPSSSSTAPATPATLTLHADLPWTEKHLKALGITAERTPGLTTIAAGKDPAATVAALAKVLQGLRLRMSIHEQNLRNAERVRDADNRINPYRRKILEIGAQGEPLEKADPSPLQKVSKPGDPNADADGFVMLPNVNRAVETSEFQSAADEYKLIRSALERLAPEHIFPDPIALPQQ